MSLLINRINFFIFSQNRMENSCNFEPHRNDSLYSLCCDNFERLVGHKGEELLAPKYHAHGLDMCYRCNFNYWSSCVPHWSSIHFPLGSKRRARISSYYIIVYTSHLRVISRNLISFIFSLLLNNNQCFVTAQFIFNFFTHLNLKIVSLTEFKSHIYRT